MKKSKRPITKGYISHRLLKLEHEIILTDSAIRRWRGSAPIALHEILESARWAKHMMGSYQLMYWLSELPDISEWPASKQYEYYLTDRETPLEEYRRELKDPTKQKIIKYLQQKDQENGCIPKGI